MKLAGYIYNGRYYPDLSELSGRTFSDGSKPEAVYYIKKHCGTCDHWYKDSIELPCSECKDFDRWEPQK